jgi:hypothetical protein
MLVRKPRDAARTSNNLCGALLCQTDDGVCLYVGWADHGRAERIAVPVLWRSVATNPMQHDRADHLEPQAKI